MKYAPKWEQISVAMNAKSIQNVSLNVLNALSQDRKKNVNGMVTYKI